MIWQSTSIVVARASVQGLFAKRGGVPPHPEDGRGRALVGRRPRQPAGVAVRRPRARRHRRRASRPAGTRRVGHRRAARVAHSRVRLRPPQQPGRPACGASRRARPAPAYRVPAVRCPTRDHHRGRADRCGATVVVAGVLLAPAGQQVVSPNPLTPARGHEPSPAAQTPPSRPARPVDVGSDLGADRLVVDERRPARTHSIGAHRSCPHDEHHPAPTTSAPTSAAPSAAPTSASSVSAATRGARLAAAESARRGRRGGTGSPSRSRSAGTPGGPGSGSSLRRSWAR